MGLTSHTTLFPVLLLCLALYCTPAAAFGAGNIASISKIEGQNWRHGDLEDTLLQLFLAAGAAGGQRRKFSNMDVKRIYFGNWLRDYSQAIDTGALKYVEAETVRILLWVLSFMTFGYATREFEVTAERLGCYRPEEHIDNPKDYNDNNDARDMHSALRGPVDEEVELAIDPETGLKNYIATEGRRLSNGEDMVTSAQMLRSLFSRSIALGRQYARNGREEDLFEAFRLMGTGLHCIEDFSAHSNYTELALIELGEYDVFPHVGANTMVNVQGREIWPLVTGTFGGVDFLHSVLGEVNDKALQSEISQLEHTISEAQQTGQSDDEQSIIRDLMSKLNIGGKDDIDSKTSELKQKSDAQKEATENGSPFGLSQDAKQLGKDIYPFLEFHDELMRSINQALESVGLDMVMEKLAEAVSVFVFCLLAPYILPVIKQASNELKTGSSEVIASSEAQQHIVFDDDNSSNPTHSMLSKDHFTNLLNEPAGKVASAVLKFAVPLLMNAWDDEGIDPNQVCDEIIGGVFHHPAFRNGEDGRPGVEGRQMMFAVVEEWWSSKDSHQQEDLRAHLSRDGVQQGKNHKAGAHDSGHGCGAPIHRSKPKNRGGDIGGAVGESVGMALENALSGGKKGGDSGLGGMLGSLLGGAISQRLGESGSGGGSGGGQSRSESYSSHQESYSSSRQEYSSYEQTSSYGGGDERSSYSTRESYETPEYSRTTERYRESGREPEEETRYESRREYEPSDQPSWEYDDSGRQDGYMRPERSYEQPERSYEQPERLYGQQQQYSDGRDGGRGRDVEYSYGGERQDYGGGGNEGGYGRRGTTHKYSSPPSTFLSHSHPYSAHSPGYGHGSSSNVLREKEDKKKKDKKKKKGGDEKNDEEEEEEEDGKKSKDKKKEKEKGKKGKKYESGDREYRPEDEDEDEGYEKKKKEKKDKKKSYDDDGDEDEDEEYGKKKKEKKEKKKKFKDEDGDGEDDDEEWGKKKEKKKEKKYDDEDDEGDDEDRGKKKEKEKKYKEKDYSGGEDEEEHGYKKKDKKYKEKSEKKYGGGGSEDEDEDGDYKKKKDKKKYKY